MFLSFNFACLKGALCTLISTLCHANPVNVYMFHRVICIAVQSIRIRFRTSPMGFDKNERRIKPEQFALFLSAALFVGE